MKHRYDLIIHMGTFKIKMFLIIVLFKSFRNFKRCNKGNFTSNSFKQDYVVWEGQHYLVLNKILAL